MRAVFKRTVCVEVLMVKHPGNPLLKGRGTERREIAGSTPANAAIREINDGIATNGPM